MNLSNGIMALIATASVALLLLAFGPLANAAMPIAILAASAVAIQGLRLQNINQAATVAQNNAAMEPMYAFGEPHTEHAKITGFDQISAAMNRFREITQQNAAAQEMTGQAFNLKDLMQLFQLATYNSQGKVARPSHLVTATSRNAASLQNGKPESRFIRFGS